MEQLLVLILIGIVVFIILRGFWLWYFKIQEHIDLMKEQNEILKVIFKQLGGSIEDKQ